MNTANTALAEKTVDIGLQRHMMSVYNHMMASLGITGIIGYLVSKSPEMVTFLYSGIMGWVTMLAPLAFMIFLMFKLSSSKTSPTTGKLLLYGFAALMGLIVAGIFLQYTMASIILIFFITSAMFAGISLWGYTTKKDLSGWGTFLFMALIGLIIASIVNIFLANTMMDMIVSAIAVLVFAGFTAYDTQQIKDNYDEADDNKDNMAIFGAIGLYLDFLNIFIHLLHLFGDKNVADLVSGALDD